MIFAEGRFCDAIATLDPMPAELIARLQPGSLARRAYGLGIARMQLGELAQAWALFGEARHALDSAGNARGPLWGGSDPLVMTLVLSSHVRARQGLLDQAHCCAEEALQVSQDVGHTHTQAFAQMNFALSLLRKGEMAAAAEHGTRALQLSDRFGFMTVKAFVLMAIGCAQVAGGQLDDGTRLAREGNALLRLC